jgi:hypothetical protein
VIERRIREVELLQLVRGSERNGQRGEHEYTKMADVPVPGFGKYWIQKLASLKSECYGITNKYPEAAAVVQEVHNVLSDIEILSGCTSAKVGESSEWTSVVKRAEENRANVCKAEEGKPFFRALYGMCAVALNEL